MQHLPVAQPYIVRNDGPLDDDLGGGSLGRRSLLKGLGAGTAMLALASARPSAVDAAPLLRASGLPQLSGLPWASGCTSNHATFASDRGRPVDVIGIFTRRDTWASIRVVGGLGWLNDPSTGPRPEAIMVSYPLFPNNDSPKTKGIAAWQAGARGDYDWHHDAAASSLARYSQQFILRLGWEWNIPSYPWACASLAAAPYYVAYFRRVVDRFRARLPNILIDWCGNKGSRIEGSIDGYYPGSNWVDFIGHDKYDWWSAATTQAKWDKELDQTKLGSPRGINAWLEYAKSKGKRLSVAEWAVVSGVSEGGGDNPIFISNMLAFMRAHAADIGYECYFNTDHLPNRHVLANHPQARAAYRASMS